MLEVFRSIFLGERNKFNVDAQTSLKLLRDFPELLPLGSDRVEVIDQIANNLINEQFYGNASELLEPLITDRLLSFKQKKQLIVKVGLLHIINQQPENAINIFELYRADLGLKHQMRVSMPEGFMPKRWLT